MGVFLVIVGIISWGVATDWKFIGDSKKSGGGGPPPPPPSPPSDKCDGKCKKGETCRQSINDGTTYKCCPNTIPDSVFDGDKCCSRDNIVDNKCCDNPSKHTIKTTSFFKEIYGKQCCDTKPYDKSDSNGCYELCGDNKTRCYQLKGEYCESDSGDDKYQCVSNPECQWESLPSPSPITDQSIPCSSDGDCIVGSCDSTNNKCNIHTVGLTDDDDFKGDEYRFTFMEDDYKPTNWRFERKIEVQETAQDKKCTKNDCKIAFQNYNPAGAQWNTTTGVCSTIQNLDKFNTNTKCPFTDTTRCCVKSGGGSGEFTGQICEKEKVGAINKSIPTSSGGYLSECVKSGDCVDSNGEICGGHGYCQYDATLNDGNGGGKCVCNDPKFAGDKCQQTTIITDLDNVYVLPYCPFGSSKCPDGQYPNTPCVGWQAGDTGWISLKFQNTGKKISSYTITKQSDSDCGNDSPKCHYVLADTLLKEQLKNWNDESWEYRLANDGQIYVITDEQEENYLWGTGVIGETIDVYFESLPRNRTEKGAPLIKDWGTFYVGDTETVGQWGSGTYGNTNRWDDFSSDIRDQAVQGAWTIISAYQKSSGKTYYVLMNCYTWFKTNDKWYSLAKTNDWEESFSEFAANSKLGSNFFLKLGNDSNETLGSSDEPVSYNNGSIYMMFCYGNAKSGSVTCKNLGKKNGGNYITKVS